MECRPPLPRSAVGAAIKTAFGPRLSKIRDRKIADWLLITEQESQQLEKLGKSPQFESSPVQVSVATPRCGKEARWAAMAA
jgi:hypothetical protein